MRINKKLFNWLVLSSLLVSGLSSCTASQSTQILPLEAASSPTATVNSTAATAIPTRPIYEPATLVDYTAQPGDSLDVLAVRFNTTVKEILEANPLLPEEITTLQAGLAMKIPIYYEALWGSQFQILPDSLFVNGPQQIGFDTSAFVNSHPGWLKNYTVFAGEQNRTGGEVIDYVAVNYSVSPRLLLTIAEYEAGALSEPILDPDKERYPLGYEDQFHQGFYMQLVWAANQLNNGYYSWRTGKLDTIYRSDGSMEIPDPWQNAATVAIQSYFSQKLSLADYLFTISHEGFYQTYTNLFGDPWQNIQPHIPGNLVQPDFTLPFVTGKTWALTGGPHAAWGEGEPFAALDFAPPGVVGGCSSSSEFVTAVADGQIVRTDTATALLDLDQDGDERTGWVILYLHLRTSDMVRPGVLVKTGDPIGHPSCEGGTATGTHVHIARKYNGEWIDADSAVPFNLEGWIASNGSAAYLGTLKRFGKTVTASDTASTKSLITAK